MLAKKCIHGPKNGFFFLKWILCLFAAVVLAAWAQASPRAGADWRLIWSDEFDSGSSPQYPNSANWGYEAGYVRNQEWQYYTTSLENAYCQDGFLHIEAHKHPAGTYATGDYTGQDGSISSASLVSHNKVQHRYGWLEMRARIDTQWGNWPAFWTLGVNGEWPDNGECDIMEWYQNYLHFNVAWWKTGDARWTARWDSTTMYVSSMPQFHVWAMEWTPQQVRLYLDGALQNTWDSSQDSGDSSIEGFQQDHYIILNQAIGGTAGGDASGVVYPTNYEVDWVRWYEDATNYVDDGDGGIAYSGTWGTWTGNPGYNQTEHYSETTGSEAAFTFTGSKAWYYGFKRSDLGYAQILLDGQLVDTVDCYSSSSQYFVPLYESPVLTYGEHTLTVRVAGSKNPASSGTEVIVDAFGYTIPTDVPTHLTALPDNHAVYLNWADYTQAAVSHYKVYSSTAPGGPYTLVAGNVPNSEFTDTGLMNGTPEYYVVTVVDTGSNESGHSNEASAIPALGRQIPITASVAGAEEAGNPAVNSYDNNETTRWCDDNVLANAWIQYDLGAVYDIDQVRLMMYKGDIRTYPIQIEVDGNTVFTGTIPMIGDDWGTTFPTVSGRYVTISMTAPNSDGSNWFSIFETQIRALPEYQGDLTLDGRVDLQDTAELGSGWQTFYGMQTLLDIADDWLQGI